MSLYYLPIGQNCSHIKPKKKTEKKDNLFDFIGISVIKGSAAFHADRLSFLAINCITEVINALRIYELSNL